MRTGFWPGANRGSFSVSLFIIASTRSGITFDNQRRLSDFYSATASPTSMHHPSTGRLRCHRSTSLRPSWIYTYTLQTATFTLSSGLVYCLVRISQSGSTLDGQRNGSDRSEEHTSELQSRGLISYAVFCL